MNNFNTVKAPLSDTNIIRFIKGLVFSIKTAFLAKNAARETYKQLSKLSADQLKDIGLFRYEVERLNSGFF